MDAMDARVGADRALARGAVLLRARATGDRRRARAPAGTELDLSTGEWLLNPGGVGQPRDGDPRAAWLLLDTGDVDRRAGAASSTRSTRPPRRSRRPGCPRRSADRLYAGQ